MRPAVVWVLAAVAALAAFVGWLIAAPPRGSAFYPFPAGKECAVAIIDDADASRLETAGPVYALLDSLGLRVTKAIWAFDHAGRDPADVGLSLEDPTYRTWVAREAEAGHEIALNSPSCGDDDRATILAADERFIRALGLRRRLEVFHDRDREALYGGVDRIPNRAVRAVWTAVRGGSGSEGHVPGSEFYWLDLARGLVRYVGGYTIDDLNTLALNPSMPYDDAATPLAPLWFAGTDGRSADRFVALLAQEGVDRLRIERGVAIVRTRFGSGFAVGGPGDGARPRPDVRETLLRCGTDPRIEFVPAGELLDRLRVIQLVENALAEGRSAAAEGGWSGTLRVELPRELLPVVGGVSIDPGRLPRAYRRGAPLEGGRVALLPWMATARIATDIVPASVYEGARRIGWRERWRLVIRWATARGAPDLVAREGEDR
jgi:hypothetical protein